MLARPALPLALESDLKARAHVLSHHPQGIVPTQRPCSIQESPGIHPEVSSVNTYIHLPVSTHDFPIRQRLYPQIPKFSIQYIKNPPVYHGSHGFTHQYPQIPSTPKS